MFEDTQLKKINVQVISKDKCYLTATWSRAAKPCKIIKHERRVTSSVSADCAEGQLTVQTVPCRK